MENMKSPLFLHCIAALFCLFVARNAWTQEPVLVCDIEPTDMEIIYGDLVTCSLSGNSDSDSFRWIGSEGDVAVFRTKGAVFLEACIRIFDPTQTEIASSSCINNQTEQQVELTLPSTGTYAAIVSDRDGNEEGDYNLILERIVPESPAAARIPEFGVPIEGSIEIDGDIDVYLFNVVGDETIDIRAIGDVFLEPCLFLYGPDGILIDSSTCINNDVSQEILSVNPTNPGTYAVRVEDGGSNESGTYDLTVTCLFGTCVASPRPVPAIAQIFDSNNDGSSEIASLQNVDALTKIDGPFNIQINDVATGVSVRNLSYLSALWSIQQMVPVSGIGTGSALGVVATRERDDLPIIQLKDVGNGTIIRNLFPWSTVWNVLDVVAVDGVAPGGGPAIATLARRKNDGLQGVEFRDPVTGNLIRIIYPLGFNWTPTQMIVLDVNGTPAVGVLNTNDTSGLAIVQVRSALDGTLIRNVYPLGLGWSPVEVKHVPDLNNNGADEVAVRMTRDTDGLEIIQIRDGLTQALISNVYPIGAGFGVWQTQQFEVLNNNGTVTLGILSERSTDNQILLQLKDAATTAIIKNTFFIGPPWKYQPAYRVISDFTGNGTDEAAVLVRNRDTGSRLIQLRDTADSSVIRNINVN